MGVVDKEAVSVRIFSLLPIWFLYYRGGPTIGSLSLNPRLKAAQSGDVGAPLRGVELAQWPGHYHYDVDLGHPVAILDLPTIKDESRTRAAKGLLRMAVDYAERNLLHYRLQIPHFYWFAKTAADASSLRPAYAYHPVPDSVKARGEIMEALAPSLISFAMHFKKVGDAASLGACATLLSHAPPEIVPDVVLDHVPELRRPRKGSGSDE